MHFGVNAPRQNLLSTIASGLGSANYNYLSLWFGFLELPNR